MNFLSKKILTIALGIFVAVLGLTLLSVNSPKVNAATTPTVTICHGNNDVNNPYVKQSPNIQNNGTLDGGHLNDIGPIATSFSVAQSLKNSKTQWGDIIPAYTSGNFIFAGLNWTTIGQAMLHNNCGYVTPVCTDSHATNYVANPTTSQYSDNSTCTYTPAGTCPTVCGQPASTVPDGKGGTISCDATSACVVDQCSNIIGVQATVPDGDYQLNGQCFPKTHVCNDANALNYVALDTTKVADITLCLYTPAGTCPIACGHAASTVPNGHGGFTQCNATSECEDKREHVCTDPKAANYDADFDSEEEVSDSTQCKYPTPTVSPSPSITPSVTPIPTQTPSNPGGPGDGRSDGKSDGGSSCPSCTQAPHTQVLGASTGPAQAVLGASTMAGTGTFENTLMEVMMIAGTIVLGAGLKSYAKEKKN